jgi:hypothetical protein
MTALIVGLHFLPLARVFAVPLYSWTGGGAILLVLVCAFIPDASLRVLLLGLGMGVILWLSAALVLYRTRLPEGA